MKNQLRRFCTVLAVVALLAGCEVVRAPAPGTEGEQTQPQAPAAQNQVVAPTPIPSAADLLADALNQRTLGNDDTAATDLSTLITTYPEASEVRAARYYLAESFARRGRWSSAATLFQMIADNPNVDVFTPLAMFWLARSYESAGDAANAAVTYERYRAFNTVLEPYAAMRQAAQQQVLGQIAEAADNYEHAANADIVRGERAGSYEKAIALRRQLGQDDQALQRYSALVNFAEQPGYRARILADGVALAQQQGRNDLARAWLFDLLATAPATVQAANAVDQLRTAGDPGLVPRDAAQVYFNVERYGDAIPLFDAAIAQTADVDESIALQRLRGLAIRETGDFAAALDALAAASALDPNSEPGRQAQLDWIQTLGQQGDAERASQAYLEYAVSYPADPRAAEALDRASQLRERLGDNAGATQIRLELGQRYPQSEQAAFWLQHTGLALFREGRMAEAQAAWQQLANGQTDGVQAQGAFWAGRAAAQQNDDGQARDLFAAAIAADADSYYGARAADELNAQVDGAVALDAPISDDDWRGLTAWVASWAAPPDAAAAPVSDNAFVQRAVALEAVGLQSEALGEWNDLRQAWQADASRLLQLARVAHERNVPYIGLKAAEQIALLAPDDAPLPEPLRRLIFPTPYPELVAAQSREQGIDPRLLYALMRQESLFNPGATSWVGARGLAQVMPTTGEGIAQNLGISDFTSDDLYRPAVSVRFGAFYFSQRLADMQGSPQGALAAYNGGLGNALRWANGDTVADADLFTESIDFPETRNYVKRVYGYYGAYQRLYARP